MIKSKNHRKQIRFSRLFIVPTVCASLLLTACGGDARAAGELPGDSSGNSPGNSTAGSAQQREWVYVPEVITMEDEHADYERMQLNGDTLCYVLQGGDIGDGAKGIGRYSLTDRELKRVPLDWTEGGRTGMWASGSLTRTVIYI